MAQSDRCNSKFILLQRGILMPAYLNNLARSDLETWYKGLNKNYRST